jgi:EAL domain-containing protein (putative c-di-GMP-specific phosphodiesterase class I)
VDLIDQILEPGGLRVLFQPIVEVRNGHSSVHALECLTRGPRGTNFEHAGVLFEYVRRKREESRVDRACVGAALQAAGPIVGRPVLSLNVHASTLGRDLGFPEFVAQTAAACGITLSELIVEIVEHAPPWDGRSFLAALDALRALGVRIALDDVGLGQSNYRMVLDCRPDYFKIDRYFAHGSAADPHRRAVMESVHQLATKFGASVVAEGIEAAEDLATVTGLGIRLVQGFFFSRPLSPEQLETALPALSH